MSSGATAEDKSWKSKEQAEEAQYAHKKEQEQLATLKEKLSQQEQSKSQDRDFEGGFGGQEDLEDRYATTSGEH
ncbi:uncharacterized protein ARMOST_08031 [Armillaria ostoyae]|uniref:ATPase inhibitor, mitochondrial n=1 Tax=Armillaria ostoyae TaxID=47428 RepID=A0A284R7I2_ARMOS|nr:uncharacterized protein ARMOST_08031 [Armillaria ostoyae]